MPPLDIPRLELQDEDDAARAPRRLSLPAPPLGAAPATTSSGDVIENLIQGQIDKLTKYEQMGPLEKFFGGGAERRRAIESLPPLIGARKDAGAQQAAMTKNTLDFSKLIAEHAEKFFALSPEVQEQTRPLMQSVFTRGAKMAGLPLDEGTIAQAFNTQGFAQKAIALFFTDAAYTPDERQYWGTQMASAKTPEGRDKVLMDAEKLATDRLTQVFRLRLPGMVAEAGGTTAQPLEVAQFTRFVQGKIPTLAQSPLLAKAFVSYVGNPANAEELAGYGLKSGKVALAGQMKKEERVAEGPQLSQGVKDILSAQGLTPATASAPQIAAARDQAKQEVLTQSREQGIGAELVKRGFEVSPETRAKHVDVNALLATGDLVQPPAGITQAELNKDPRWAAIDDKQREALRQLKPTRVQLDIFQQVARRVITAQNPADAAAQGLKLYAGAVTGANPEAKAYRDASEGFLGNLSRSVGGEKGVITNQDVDRIRRAAIASFFDTAQAREFKAAIINDIWGSAHQALVAEISGKPAGAFRSQVQDLLKKLDAESHASLGKAMPADQKMVINDKTGEVGVIPKRAATPPGWKDMK